MCGKGHPGQQWRRNSDRTHSDRTGALGSHGHVYVKTWQSRTRVSQMAWGGQEPSREPGKDTAALLEMRGGGLAEVGGKEHGDKGPEAHAFWGEEDVRAARGQQDQRRRQTVPRLWACGSGGHGGHEGNMGGTGVMDGTSKPLEATGARSRCGRSRMSVTVYAVPG